ncbi:cell division protein ZapA [Govanella unica]|uniref:Cell division protein ZapA n=1 Tax=Govanella unica TaxID=2975056 RepID=A0A9X3U0I0_9PROT|nr:cell division protein ZapA [Govania unica]MDA5194903.1 cell division protein ZapA [Govania unica]
MGQVTVTIFNQRYQLACKDGEEARLEKLALYIDQKVEGLQQSLGNVGDSRLFLMAALVIADELMEARDRIPAGSGERNGQVANLAERLAAAAAEIEDIAARLEKP